MDKNEINEQQQLTPEQALAERQRFLARWKERFDRKAKDAESYKKSVQEALNKSKDVPDYI